MCPLLSPPAFRSIALWGVVGVMAMAALGCSRSRHVFTPQMDRSNCLQEVEEAFGAQDAHVVAIRPVDEGPLFRPEVLESVDRVCQSFQDAMTDDLVAVKCLTDLPMMEGRPAGVRVVVAREAFPFTETEALEFQQLVLQMEFARRDVVDGSGGLATYVHLPTTSFEGVDIPALVASALDPEAALLKGELDPGESSSRDAYREMALDGPSSSYLIGLYDTGIDWGLTYPENLLALQAFQAAAEGHPAVAQTFTLADDLKVVRRGLHKGNLAEAVIPGKRIEISQLMLALNMNPASAAFGPRIDTVQRVALVRLNLSVSSTEQQLRLRRKLDRLLETHAPEGGRAFLCMP